MMASESGTVATIIAIILGIALTGWIFYLIIKKRTAKLAELYPNDKFIAVKETIACLGMLFASIFMLLLIFLPFLRRRD